MTDHSAHRVLGLTATVVSAYLRKSPLEAGYLPALIETVYGALARVGIEVPAPAQQMPAVPWKKSVFPAYIICLEDGQKLTLLKQHLRRRYDLTPDAYREKWNLPRDYPTVAPEYVKRRSDLAKSFGLGRRTKPLVNAEPKVTRVPARRARGAK